MSSDEEIDKNVTDWLGALTGKQRGSKTFCDWLMDGTVLCETANKVRDGSISNTFYSKAPYKHIENLKRFNETCLLLGVSEAMTFEPVDFYEQKSIRTVLLCINEFGTKIRTSVPEFQGPFLGCAAPVFDENATNRVIKGKNLEEDCIMWIEEITGEKKGDLTFGDWLDDGVVLCKVANVVKAGSCPKVNDSKKPFKRMENISSFIKAARDLGVLEKDVFSTVDLSEQKDMMAVQRAISNFGAAIQKSCPAFKGPRLGIVQNAKVKREATRRQYGPGEIMAGGLRRDVR